MSITWSYGVTTVASRIASGLLERTLNSLSKGGFPNPRLFIDGIPSEALPGFASNLQVTCRNPAIKIYGNFHLGLSELFIRDAHADFYAMFQDDFVTYPHLREYLEACDLPTDGYFNLYTFPENERPNAGWNLSNQLGKGAVALVFSNVTAKALLHSPYWIGRPASNPDNKDRLWKFVDGGIVESMRKAGYKEYVHNPSLVQHTGLRSSLGNGKQLLATTFKGEDFDALRLLPKGAPVVSSPKTCRIGLVGHNVASGLGELNRQLAEYTDIYRWLIRPHGKHKTLELPDTVDCIVCPTGVKIPEFLKDVDVVLFAEVPLYDNLLTLCKQHGKKTVCIPMQEWMPPGARGWPEQVDLFICPTNQCYQQFSHLLPCVYFPWPVDTNRFKFKQRTICERFLFVNGHGGWHGRKGADVVKEVLKQWPDMPLIVYDQTGAFPNKKPSPENNADLYNEGDVLISPHSVDGLGLEGMEAMTCGMPVISTDGQPWNEIPALARIKSTSHVKQVRRPVDWYTPDPAHLLEICKSWLGKDISQQSMEARQWAERNAWDKIRADIFNDLVRSVGRSKPVALPKIKVEPVTDRKARWDKFLFAETITTLAPTKESIIVELGALRDTRPIAKKSDGWSTVEWAKTEAQIHCVDNDPAAITASKKLVPDRVFYHCCDGFEFLSKLGRKIDLLYLDGPDANKGGQEFHLKALLAAPLADKCLVLMDDCDLWPGRWQGRGKGELAIPKALEMGFKILHDNGRQVLLSRGYND